MTMTTTTVTLDIPTPHPIAPRKKTRREAQDPHLDECNDSSVRPQTVGCLRHLGDIWEASGRLLGDIWKASGVIWEASGRLGGALDLWSS